jgi:hypothetical protein
MAKQTFTTGQVLTAAQMTSLQQTAMLGGAASAKTASYTLVAADAGTAISMSNASATTITVNTALFAAGDTVQITNLGAGICTITAGTATVNTSATLALAQYESGTLDFTSTSAAIFIKGAGAASGGAGDLALITSGSLSGTSLSVSSLSNYTNISFFFDGVTWSTAAGDDLFIRINGVTTSVYRQMGWLESNSPASDRLALTLLSGIRLTVGSSYYQRYDRIQNSYFVNLSNCKNTGFTNFEILSTYIDNTNVYRVNFIGSGIFEDNSTVSSISFFTGSSYTFNAGTYRIYGE